MDAVVTAPSPPMTTSTIDISHSVVKNGYQGTMVINQEPIFEDAEHGNFRLSSKNPASLLSGGDSGALKKYISGEVSSVPIGIVSQ